MSDNSDIVIILPIVAHYEDITMKQIDPNTLNKLCLLVIIIFVIIAIFVVISINFKHM